VLSYQAILWYDVRAGSSLPGLSTDPKAHIMPDDVTDPYADIAEYYDLEHDSFTDDVECYAALIREYVQKPSRMLEVGAGSARVAAALAGAGLQVTGVEPSAAMRARAERRLAAFPDRLARRVRMVAGTATQPNLAPSDRFDIALFGLNLLSHLLDQDERQAALVETARHLAPGGILLVDLDVAAPRRLSLLPGTLLWQGTWPLPGSGAGAGAGAGTEHGEVSHFIITGHQREPGLLDLLHMYDLQTPDGVVRRRMVRMPLAVISYGELRVALVAAGYRIEATFGSHDLAPYDDDAPRAIVVASVQADQVSGTD
jgi:SAM-dependent methyltransferase